MTFLQNSQEKFSIFIQNYLFFMYKNVYKYSVFLLDESDDSLFR